MLLWIPISNYEKHNLVSVCSRDLGRIFSLYFVTSVGITIIMRELPDPNACRGDGEILGAGSEGEGGVKDHSFRPIQLNVVAATL